MRVTSLSVSFPRRTCHRFLRECIVSWTTCASTDCAMEAFRRDPWNYSSASPLPRSQTTAHPSQGRRSLLRWSRLAFRQGPAWDLSGGGVLWEPQGFVPQLRLFISARFYAFANDQEAKAAVEKLVPNQLMRFRALRLVGIGAVLSPLLVFLKGLVWLKAHLLCGCEQMAFEMLWCVERTRLKTVSVSDALLEFWMVLKQTGATQSTECFFLLNCLVLLPSYFHGDGLTSFSYHSILIQDKHTFNKVL